jgi:hypothetical protein
MSDNLAIHTLADGTKIDTQNLPPGQRICTHCMHLHPEEHVYFGPLSRDRETGHWAQMRRGELACVGCRVHGPHPDMP